MDRGNVRLRARPRRTERLLHAARLEGVLRWSALRRAALGLAALLTIVGAISMVGLAMSGSALEPEGAVALGFGGLVVVAFALLALENPRIDRTRAAWLVAMALAPALALLPYWWLHVWRAPRDL